MPIKKSELYSSLWRIPVAKLIRKELVKMKSIDELPQETRQFAENLFGSISKAFER